jgi:hypothetical protein
VLAIGFPIGTDAPWSRRGSKRWIVHPTVVSVGPYSLRISSRPPDASTRDRASAVVRSSPPTIILRVLPLSTPLPSRSARCDGGELHHVRVVVREYAQDRRVRALPVRVHGHRAAGDQRNEDGGAVRSKASDEWSAKVSGAPSA